MNKVSGMCDILSVNALVYIHLFACGDAYHPNQHFLIMLG